VPPLGGGMDIFMEEVFHSLIQVVPLIKELFEDDIAITVEDSNEFLYISYDKGLEMPYKVGGRIEDNASRLEVISSTVERITSQTNLLALNTGVEAVRAGEFGRGFSVIAQEMRRLSLQSGESSKRITVSLSEMESNIKSITFAINSLGGSCN
jgi:AraC-like DNA-binding protein